MNKIIITYLTIALISLVIGFSVNQAREEERVWGDEIHYYNLSRDLLKTGEFGWPGARSYKAPLVTFVWVSSYKFFYGSEYHGESFKKVGRYLQTILGAIVILLTLGLGHYLMDLKTGVLASIFVWLNTYWWLNNSLIAQENLLAVLLMSSTFLVLLALRSKKK